MTSSHTRPVDRDNTTPFHVKVFYRTGAFLRTEELLAEPRPPYKPIWAWRDSTLQEMAEDLSFDYPVILSPLFIGTRLEFRHVFQAPLGPNTNRPTMNRGGGGGPSGGPSGALSFTYKDMGSIVFGAGRPGASAEEGWDGVSHDSRTLQDVRFVQGDMLICAIMPPDERTGDVVPAGSAKVGRGIGIGEAGPGGVGFDNEQRSYSRRNERRRFR